MDGMTMNRWQSALAVAVVVMMFLCLAVWAGVRGCDEPVVDDDDSATDDDVFDELDQEFSGEDEAYQPGVL